MPHSLQRREMSPKSSSISFSYSLPMLTWMDTASAPILSASSTVVTRIFWSVRLLNLVLAERCTIKPMSRPKDRWLYGMMPLCSTTAVAPPWATLSMVDLMSTSPSMGPMVMPWAMGTMTARPVPRSIIRSILTLLPSTFSPSCRVNQ
jgi:hypothetical protein